MGTSATDALLPAALWDAETSLCFPFHGVKQFLDQPQNCLSASIRELNHRQTSQFMLCCWLDSLSGEFKPGNFAWAAEVTCHFLQDSTNKEALLPSVCALSLIPRAGRKHMPQLLQPLMDDDSPVADVFDSCSVCDQLTAENSHVSTVSALLLVYALQRPRGTAYKL